ncbi:hypothetical protein L218DRAFT_336240 [Marasmius fiardii PR-910]|nr:hypothetical protein L218DRAFT_336240 [Marasmius fiardii PR-910]
MQETFGHQRAVSYVDVLSAMLLVYELLINLSSEIELIWMRNWTFFTVLYVLQRYLPLFDAAGLVLHHHFGANLRPGYCSLNYRIAGLSFTAGVLLSEILLTLRVWAVWKRSITVAIGLILFFLACWVPASTILMQSVTATKFAAFPLSNFRGCFIFDGSHVLYVVWVLWMVYDTGTLAMMLIPGITVYRRGGRSELIQAIYQDGVIYYLFISCE